MALFLLFCVCGGEESQLGKFQCNHFFSQMRDNQQSTGGKGKDKISVGKEDALVNDKKDKIFI